MSIDSLFQDLLPQFGDLSENFIKGSDLDSLQELDNKMQLRGPAAIELQNAPDRVSSVANQAAYDAVSVVERQVTVVALTREDYHTEAQKQRKQSALVYQDIRAQGTALRNLLPPTDTEPDDAEEPYIDDSGNIVFDTDE